MPATCRPRGRARAHTDALLPTDEKPISLSSLLRPRRPSASVHRRIQSPAPLQPAHCGNRSLYRPPFPVSAGVSCTTPPTRAGEASTSAAWLWRSVTGRAATAGVDGTRLRRARLGAPMPANPVSTRTDRLRSFARYAEVLIDVRAHTESVVNLEPLQLFVGSVFGPISCRSFCKQLPIYHHRG